MSRSWDLNGVFGVLYRKYAEKIDFFDLKKETTFAQNPEIWPFLAKLQTKMIQKFCRKQIFDIFTFFRFLAGFWANFFQIFEPKKPHKIRKKKRKYQKSVFYRIFVSILSVTWPKMDIFGCSGQKLFHFLG